jgi:hypothetical protein
MKSSAGEKRNGRPLCFSLKGEREAEGKPQGVQDGMKDRLDIVCAVLDWHHHTMVADSQPHSNLSDLHFLETSSVFLLPAGVVENKFHSLRA